MDASTNVCQAPNCHNLQFTFCPHCSRHVCIKCLNEHYVSTETDFCQEMRNFQDSLRPNRPYLIDQQRTKLNQIYAKELNIYNHYKSFFHEIIGNDGRPRLTQFQPGRKIELKRDFELLNFQRMKFDRLFNEIQHLLEQYDQNSSPIEFPSSITKFHHLETKKKSVSPVIVEIGSNSSEDESSCSFDGKNEKFFSIESIDSAENDLKPKKKYTTKQLKSFRSTCPFTKHDFGLQKHHCVEYGIGNILCRRSSKIVSLLHLHLTKHHHFNGVAAFQIVQTLLDHPKDFDQIDLFSKSQLHSIAGNPISWYLAPCPLKRYGIFGILPEHKVKLCSEYRTHSIRLHHHLVLVHGIRHRCASKIIQALMKKEDPDTPLFPPTEVILQMK